MRVQNGTQKMTEALEQGVRIANALRPIMPTRAWVLCYVTEEGTPTTATTLPLDLAKSLMAYVADSFIDGKEVEMYRTVIKP